MKTRLLFFLFLAFLANTVSAQTTVQIGSGTDSTAGYPLYLEGNLHSKSRNIAIYTAAELTNAGVIAGEITDIGWEIAQPATLFNGNIALYLASTNLSSVILPTDWVATVANATKVYDSTEVLLPDSTNWAYYHFKTPFYWNGTSNVQVCVQYQATICGSPCDYMKFKTANYPNAMSIYEESTSSLPAILTKSSPKRANTKFKVSNVAAISPELNIEKMVLYPNPAKENLFVQGLNDSKVNAFSVFNMQGKCVHNQAIKGDFSFDISTYPKGIYLLKLEDTNNQKYLSQKFIIE